MSALKPIDILVYELSLGKGKIGQLVGFNLLQRQHLVGRGGGTAVDGTPSGLTQLAE
jgi:hypothetical protein